MKSSTLNAARVIPDGVRLVPLIYLKGGENRSGTWAVCVPEDREEHVLNLLETGHTPVEDVVLTNINEEGVTSFFEVSMRDFGGWEAPNIFEEVEESFDLPAETLTVLLDGKKPMPIKGVIFTDEQGCPISATVDGKSVPLRYNLTNYRAAGGTVSEDGRIYKVSVGGTEYTGHLWLVSSENAMRIYGSIAYVRLSPPPESVLVCEAASSIATLVAEVTKLRETIAILNDLNADRRT